MSSPDSFQALLAQVAELEQRSVRLERTVAQLNQENATLQAALQTSQRSQELERHNAELQQTLDRLAVSEARYRTLFELSNEGIYRFDLEQPIDLSLPLEEQFEQACQQLHISEVNRAFVNQYGFSSPDDVIGLKFTDFYPENPEVGLQAIRTFLENASQMYNIETEEVGANGQPLYFLQNGVADIKNGYLMGGWGMQTDITELRKTQQALLQAEQERVAQLSQVNAALAQANEEIVEREREKTVLLSISEALSRTSNRQALLQVIYQNIREIFPFYGSGLFIINESRNYHEYLLEPGLLEHMPSEFNGTTERLTHRGSVAEYMAQDYGVLSLSDAIKRFPGHPHYPVLQRAGIKEFIHGPLFSGEQRIGMLCFNAQSEGFYSEKDLRLFKHIADQVAVTVANILANEEILEREREKAILLEITQAISQINDTQTLFEVIYSQIQPIFHFDAASVVVLEDDASAYRVLDHENKPTLEAFFAHPLPLAGTPFEVVFSSAIADIYPADVDEWLSRYPQYEGLQHSKQAGYRQILLGKLYNGGKLLGVVGLLYQQPPVLDEAFRKLFENFVQQVAIAVANILAHQKIITQQAALLLAEQERVAGLEIVNEELRQRDRLLSTVAQVTKDLLAAEDVKVAIPAALQAVGEAATMSRVLLILERQDPSTQRLQHCVEFEWVAPGNCDHASVGMAAMDNENFQVLVQPIYRGQSVWRVMAELPDITRSQFERLNIKSTGVVPIFIEGRYIGCIAFDDCLTPRHWSQQEIDVLTAAAESIGAALHRQQLVDRLIAERLHAEQARAAELAKTNQALKNSLDRLAANPDLNAFLSYVLLEIVQQFQVELGYLWLYDAESQTLPLHLYIKDGQVQLQPELEIPAALLKPAIADLPIWETLLQTRKPFVITRENAAQYVFRGTLEWQEQQQEHQTGINLLLTLKDEPIGLLAIISTRRNFSPEELELAQALAHQATLALQLTRLAEEAKQAAIAREQEQAAQERAAELEKANQSLARTAARLVEQGDITRFFSELLLEMARKLNAHSARLMVYDPEQRTHSSLHIHVHGGNVQPEPELPANFRLDEMQPENFHTIAQRERRPRWYDPQADAALFSPGAVNYLSRAGLRAVLHVPLVAGEQIVGGIGFAFPEPRPEVGRRQALVEALAHQAALAIQLMQLAEKAKQAAIAREQEQAAQERAAELVKANAALQNCVDRLAEQLSPQVFIEHVLLEAATQVNAHTAALFVYSDAGTQSLQAFVQNGQVELIATNPDLEQFRAPVPRGIALKKNPSGNEAILINNDLSRNEAVLINLDDIQFQPRLAWLRNRGHRSIVRVPLLLGDHLIGFIGFCFQEPRSSLPQNIELVMTLAQQATVALHLAQLAEQNRQAVLIEERNRIAREIHDTLAQTFTGISIQLDNAQYIAHQDPYAAWSMIEQVKTLARQGLSEARRSVWELHPDADEYQDLAGSLQRSLDQLTASTPLQTDLSIIGTPFKVPADIGMNLLRIAQECITNTLRHAHAQTLLIELTFTTDAITLQMQDDGQGFDPEFQLGCGGFGLMGMQQRCDRLNGQFSLLSQPGQGTTIVVQIPLLRS